MWAKLESAVNNTRAGSGEKQLLTWAKLYKAQVSRERTPTACSSQKPGAVTLKNTSNLFTLKAET